MKQLPRIKSLGRIDVRFVSVLAPELGKALKAHRSDGDAPVLYVDLEAPRKGFKEQVEPELHLGISAQFKVASLSPTIKPHVDIFIPLSEARKLRELLKEVG